MSKKLKKLTPAMSRLDAFLRIHDSRYDRRDGPKIDIFSLTKVFGVLGKALEDRDQTKLDECCELIFLYGDFIDNNPRYEGSVTHLHNMSMAIKKNKPDKAILHLNRLMKVVHPVAADSPFSVGDKVSIIRSDHGWYDGRIGGTIVAGGEGGYVVEDDDGGTHDVRKTRDMR